MIELSGFIGGTDWRHRLDNRHAAFEANTSLSLAGGDATSYWAIQLGTIQASEPFASQAECSLIAAPQAVTCPASDTDCPVVPAAGLVAFKDDADQGITPGAGLFAQSNLLAATDNPADFGGDATRYSRRYVLCLLFQWNLHGRELTDA